MIQRLSEIAHLNDVLPGLMAHDLGLDGSHFGGPREEYLHSGDVSDGLVRGSVRVSPHHDGRNRPARRVIDVAPDTLNEFRHLTPHIPKTGEGITARAATSSWRGTIAQNFHSRAPTRANTPSEQIHPPGPHSDGVTPSQEAAHG